MKSVSLPMELEFPIRIGRYEGVLTAECIFPPSIWEAESTFDLEFMFSGIRDTLIDSSGFLHEMDGPLSDDINTNLLHYYAEISEALNIIFEPDNSDEIYNEDEADNDEDETPLSVMVLGIRIKMKMFAGSCEFSLYPIDPFGEEVTEDDCCG